jgi:hypothetical protein
VAWLREHEQLLTGNMVWGGVQVGFGQQLEACLGRGMPLTHRYVIDVFALAEKCNFELAKDHMIPA